MTSFSELGKVPQSQRHVDSVALRFDDLCQDGRVQLTSVVQLSQPVVWSHLGGHSGIRALWAQGVVPILSRLSIEVLPGSFVPTHPATVAIAYQFAHVLKNDAIDRLMLLIGGEVSGQQGQLFAPAGGEQRAVCGRFFADVVFTRLFAPAAERKVVRFDVPGLPDVPEHCYVARSNEAIVALPDGAAALEPGFSPDPSQIVFGVCHTDVNQHVSSFAYPRMFEEAVLRRFAALGVSAPGLGCSFEIAYRKPFVAGDRARFVLQTFRLDGRFGAVGMLVPESDAAAAAQNARAHCFLRTFFER